MSAAEDAYRHAERMIAEARESGETLLNFNRPETRALENLPPGIADLNALATLDLWNTKVTDLTPLSGLSGLQVVYLTQTPVTDLTPLSALKEIDSLDLSGCAAVDLRPLRGLQKLVDAPEFRGLRFKNSGAAQADPKIAEIAGIKRDSERARTLFAYLEAWLPPVPAQRPAPIRATWHNDRLVEVPQEDAFEGVDTDLARDGWDALKEFFADVKDTLRKDNLPNLTRAIDAFGRALGDRFEEMRPIAVGTHGQRIIEISKSSDAMLLEDAEGDLKAFAAVIATMVQRFPKWRDYVAAAVDKDPPLKQAALDLRRISEAFRNVDPMADDLALRFDDLVGLAEDGGIDEGLAKAGVLGSLSNILSRLAQKVLDGSQRVGGDLASDAYKKAVGATVLACADLFLNNGAIMIALASKFPQWLGWLENVLRFLGKG